MKLDDLDQDRFECMMKALELQMLWVELSGMNTQGYMLPRNQLRPVWRAYPIANPREREMQVGRACVAAIQSVTGNETKAFTREQVNATRNVTLACLEAYSPEVEA